MNKELIEKALKIINTNLNPKTPAEIKALKGMSLETGLNYILANVDIIMNFDILEYEIIDWGEVPIDTPILVKDHLKDSWERRHFACCSDGAVYTYPDGRTSYTVEDDIVVEWKYAKLAEPLHNTDAELDDLLDELEDSPESILPSECTKNTK